MIVGTIIGSRRRGASRAAKKGGVAAVRSTRASHTLCPVTTPSSVLSIELAGVPLRNPVLLAAGTAGYVDEMADAMPLRSVGAVVTKSITAEPREGNQTWRVMDVPGGMLNAIGLANVGRDKFRATFAPRIAEAPTRVIGSIAGHSIEDYVSVAHMFNEISHVPAVEINVSCPNVAHGSTFGESPEALRELLQAVRPALADAKLFVKMPPITSGDGSDHSMVALATVAIECGADAITIANTVPAMAIDVETRTPRLANVTGGLSGPAVHPIAVRLVHLVYRGVARDAGVPIIGAGGVVCWQDAAEFILAGATAVEIGTALFADPRISGRVVSGLERWVKRQGASSVTELIGAVRLPETKP